MGPPLQLAYQERDMHWAQGLAPLQEKVPVDAILQKQVVARVVEAERFAPPRVLRVGAQRAVPLPLLLVHSTK